MIILNIETIINSTFLNILIVLELSFKGKFVEGDIHMAEHITVFNCHIDEILKTLQDIAGQSFVHEENYYKLLFVPIK